MESWWRKGGVMVEEGWSHGGGRGGVMVEKGWSHGGGRGGVMVEEGGGVIVEGEVEGNIFSLHWVVPFTLLTVKRMRSLTPLETASYHW